MMLDGQNLRKITQANSPVDKGGLKGSINYRVAGMKLVLVARARYAGYVEAGTRPHTIVPKFAQALRWVDGAETFFAKKVRHPGTKATKFILKSVKSYYKHVRIKRVR